MTLSTVQLSDAVKYHTELMDTFYTYLEIPDQTFIDILLAIALHSRVDGHTDMLWVSVVGPQSTGKTLFGSDIFQGLKARNQAFNIGILTPKTFISGLKAGKDLLPTLDGKLVLLKDMSTIASARKETLSEIFSQLRHIYDGYFSSYWGSDKSSGEYSSKFDLIGCITDRGWQILQDSDAALGERMIPLYQRITPDQESRIRSRAMKNAGNEEEINKILCAAVDEYLDKMQDIIAEYKSVTVSNAIDAPINILSTLVDKLRTLFEYEFFGKDGRLPIRQIKNSSGSRFNRSIITILKLMSIMNGHSEVTDQEFSVAKRIYYSIVPVERMVILEILHRFGVSTLSNMARNLMLPDVSARKWMNDLLYLGVIRTEQQDKKVNYLLTLETRYAIDRAGLLSGSIVTRDMDEKEIARTVLYLS